eukprot:88125_1
MTEESIAGHQTQLAFRLLSHELYKYYPNHKYANQFIDLPSYINNLLHEHCLHFKRISFSHNQNKLMELFFNDDKYIDLHVLTTIFPYLQTVNISMDQPINVLCASILDFLRQHQTNSLISIHAKVREVPTNLVYATRFKECGWKLSIRQQQVYISKICTTNQNSKIQPKSLPLNPTATPFVPTNVDKNADLEILRIFSDIKYKNTDLDDYKHIYTENDIIHSELFEEAFMSHSQTNNKNITSLDYPNERTRSQTTHPIDYGLKRLQINTEVSPFKCRICRKGYKQKYHVVNHKNWVHEKCDVCGEHFEKKLLLTQHIQRIHKISNIEQKHNEYQRHTQSIKRQINTCKPIQKNNIFKKIFDDVAKVFTVIFNVEIAQNILKLFKDVLISEGFEDQESALDDVDEIENSAIITYIVDEIDNTEINKIKPNAACIISDGIKCIVENKTSVFDTKHVSNDGSSNYLTQLSNTIDSNSNEFTDSTSYTSTPPSTPGYLDPTMAYINNIAKQIIAYFRTQTNYQIGQKIARLFEDVVIEEEFDVESITDDLEEIESSTILANISEQIKGFELHSKHKQKIQQIILAKQSLKSTNEWENTDDQKTEYKQQKIKEIEIAIQKEFTNDIAIKILKEFLAAVEEEGFDDESLKADLEADNFKDSEFLTRLISIKEIASNSKTLCHNQLKLKQIILSVFNYISYIINIKLFNYNVTKENVKEAVEFLTKYCQNIYKHLMGVAKHLKESDLANPAQQNNDSSNRSGGGRGGRAGGRSGAKTEGTSLSIVKAFDYINRKPITLWLLNLYSQERARKYRNGELLPSVGYTPGQWWKDPNNKFSKHVTEINSTMATHIEAGVTDFIKRLLPPMNFNYNLFPVICDRLDDFVQYALAFHYIAFNIKNDMKFSTNKTNGTTKFQAPIQIDFWIIPQMTKGSVMKVKPYDIKELNGRSEQKQKQSNNDIDKPPQYLTLEIGDIEDILTNPKLGYMKDEDFFVMDQPDDFFQGYEKTQRAMLAMLRKPKNWNERGNRYIFIV